MTNDIKCPSCGEVCETDQELIEGQHVVCPYCQTKFDYGTTLSLDENISINDTKDCCQENDSGKIYKLLFSVYVGVSVLGLVFNPIVWLLNNIFSLSLYYVRDVGSSLLYVCLGLNYLWPLTLFSAYTIFVAGRKHIKEALLGMIGSGLMVLLEVSCPNTINFLFIIILWGVAWGLIVLSMWCNKRFVKWQKIVCVIVISVSQTSWLSIGCLWYFDLVQVWPTVILAIGNVLCGVPFVMLIYSCWIDSKSCSKPCKYSPLEKFAFASMVLSLIWCWFSLAIGYARYDYVPYCVKEEGKRIYNIASQSWTFGGYWTFVLSLLLFYFVFSQVKVRRSLEQFKAKVNNRGPISLMIVEGVLYLLCIGFLITSVYLPMLDEYEWHELLKNMSPHSFMVHADYHIDICIYDRVTLFINKRLFLGLFAFLMAWYAFVIARLCALLRTNSAIVYSLRNNNS